MHSAVRFIGAVALYGAAALTPFWVPMVFGKKRRRRGLNQEEEEDEEEDDLWLDESPKLKNEEQIMKMVRNPPKVKETEDGKLFKKELYQDASTKSSPFSQRSKGVMKRRWKGK